MSLATVTVQTACRVVPLPSSKIAAPVPSGNLTVIPLWSGQPRVVNSRNSGSSEGLRGNGKQYMRVVNDVERGSGRVETEEKCNQRSSKEDGQTSVMSPRRGAKRVSVMESRNSRKRSTSTDPTSKRNEPFRLIALGSRQSILDNIKRLHHLGYAEPIAWSSLQRGFGDSEYMSVLTVTGTKPFEVDE